MFGWRNKNSQKELKNNIKGGKFLWQSINV